VTGRVQGVGFRYATLVEATARGLAGWVRNLDTGQVEAVFEGNPDDVRAMVAWCREGPDGAWVRDMRVQSDEPLEGLDSFEARSTGFGWQRRRGGLP
jgi:acylphosphatase